MLPNSSTSTAAHSLPLIDQRERLIRPAKRRVRVRDLPGTLAVVRVLVARDFKVKYKQSVLGPLWLAFQPAALLVTFLVAFKGLGSVKNSDIPYAVFALCGLSAWSFFQASMTIGAASMISNINLVKSTPCPRIAPLISAVISSLPSFCVTAGAAVIGAAATGHLSLRVLLLPVALVWLLLLTLGVVAIFASVAVRYRDVLSALPFIMQLGAFVAPVGYALSALSPKLRTIVEINPITGLVETFRWMILAGYRADVVPIYISIVMSAALVVLGWRTFTARETTMADVI